MKTLYPPTRVPWLAELSQTHASARIVMLVLVAFALGLGGSAMWFHHGGKQPGPDSQGPETAHGLSSATLAILSGLEGTIDIHFYSILDPNSATETEQAFAGRADQLLTDYEQAASGRISIVRHHRESDSGPQAARADGITPFNLDKGDACYLGIAVLGNGQKEVFPRLSPDWESALESDLSRAIARVSKPKPVTVHASSSPAPDPATLEEVKRALPNLATLTVEQASQTLRETALKEAQAAIREMSSQIQTAQQRLAQSRESGSEADQEAALKDFQRVQSEQSKKLQAITGRLQSHIEALKVLKAE